MLKKIKRLRHIIKILKAGLDVETLEEIDETLTSFYGQMGVI